MYYFEQHWELTYFQNKQCRAKNKEQWAGCASECQVMETTVSHCAGHFVLKALNKVSILPSTAGLLTKPLPTQRCLSNLIALKFLCWAQPVPVTFTPLLWFPAKQHFQLHRFLQPPLLKPHPFIIGPLSQQTPAPWDDEWGRDNLTAGQK